MAVTCPVCSGKGIVRKDFYELNNGTTTDGCLPVQCRACGGRGIVFCEGNYAPQISPYGGWPGYYWGTTPYIYCTNGSNIVRSNIVQSTFTASNVPVTNT